MRLDAVSGAGPAGDVRSPVILGLAPAQASSIAVHALLKGLSSSLTVDSVVLACTELVAGMEEIPGAQIVSRRGRTFVINKSAPG